ncbi:unnamed protein product [Victoria cruziana]
MLHVIFHLPASTISIDQLAAPSSWEGHVKLYLIFRTRRMLHSCSSSASNVATKLDMSEHTIEYTPVENVSQEINMEEDVNVEGVMIMEGEMNWNEAIDLDEDFDVDDTVYKDGDMIVDEETNMDVEIEANEEMNVTEVNVNHFNIDEEDANDDHIQLRAREGLSKQKGIDNA